MDANIQLDAIAEAASVPLDQLNIADPQRFADDTIWPFFARMRREAPVHHCADSPYGPYWSLTRYQDILATEIDHATFSSDTSLGGIQIEDQPKALARPSFIRMDPPKHDEQRKVVSPIVAPANLARMETTIRERAVKIIDELPRGETFDWVDRVSNRAHHPDAGDPVRLSVQGPSAADLLVRCRGLQRQRPDQPGALGGGALRRAQEHGDGDVEAVERAGQPRRRSTI